MVTFEELTQAIASYSISWTASYPALVRNVALLTGREQEFEDDCIYVGLSSRLNPVLKVPQSCLLLVMDQNLPQIPDAAIGLAPADTDIFALFNDIRSFIETHEEAYNSRVLLDALFKGRGMQEIVDVATRILGNPLLVADTNGKVYFHSQNVVTDDPVWNEIMRLGYNPPVYRAMYRDKNLCLPVAASALPVLSDSFAEGCHRRISGKLMTNNKILGYVVVLENDRGFVEEDIKTTSLVCHVLNLELQKNVNVAMFNGSRDESLILDFLNEDSMSAKLYRERMNISGWKPYCHFYLLTIKLSEKEQLLQYSDYYRSVFEGLLPNCRTLYYNGYIIVLLDLKCLEELQETETIVIETLKSNGIHAGMSAHFSDIAELRLHYKQALKAQEFGTLLKMDGPLFHYHDFYFYDLLSRLEKVQPIESFCCPEANQLLAYDRENGTEFYKTCYTFLISGMNMAQAAKKLYVHRNTVAYRIQKIEEITGLNLSTGEDSYRLFLSFKILDMAQ